MRYGVFRLRFILRLILLIGLGYATTYFFFQTPFWLISIWSALGFILLALETIRFVERAYKELSHFLLSIEQNDFTNTYSQQSARNELQYAFHRISSVLQKLRSEKESSYQYFRTVVEHVAIPLICYNEEEEIVLMNKAAQKLFQKPYIRHLEALDRLNPDLSQTIRKMSSDERITLKLKWKKEQQTFAIDTTVFKLLGEAFKLVSIHNIQQELEVQELESWQKLIRVLTHEIMNSVIPISSLSAISSQILKNAQGNISSLTQEDYEDLRGSLITIENRSKGLINFVKAYKSLSRISEPQFEEILVEELIQEVYILLRPQLQEQKINFNAIFDAERATIMGDGQLLEQVLINLFLNSIDVLKEHPSPQINIIVTTTINNIVSIQFRDNGRGMSSEIMEQIFIPFFTTKKKGSGIGLSLSKQIMNLHKGKISVDSNLNEGTTFTLSFPDMYKIKMAS